MANEFKIKNGLLVSGSITGHTESSEENSAKMASTSWVRTHVSASLAISDYDYNITGLRNSINKVFTLSNSFVSNTTKVYLNGIRLTPGSEYDYTETSPNQITFSYAPAVDDLIIVDYVKI
jgi:hypothetical protein